MLKKLVICIFSLILMFNVLPINVLKADGEYKQLVNSDNKTIKISDGFKFESGINKSVNFSQAAVFADTGKKVNGTLRGLKKDEPITVKIPNGFKYIDGSTYDIYVEISTSKSFGDESRWICLTVSSNVNGKEYTCLELAPFDKSVWSSDPYVTFNYKIYVLDKDGHDAIGANSIDLTAGSCWTAVNEGARPWGNDDTIYTNIPSNLLEYKTSITARNGTVYTGEDANFWHITNGSYNRLNYYILGHGTNEETVKYYASTSGDNNTYTEVKAAVIKGGYVRNSESGSAEMMFGYFLSAEGEDYVGYYDGVGHSISVKADNAQAVITYSTRENGTYSSENPKYTDVGVYTTYYKISGTGYNANEVHTHTVTIKPLPLNLTPKALDKTYDGNTDATLIGDNNKTLSNTNTITLKTGIGSESFTVYGLSGNFVDPNVGYNKTVIVDSSKMVATPATNTKASNYKITVNNTNASITKANLGSSVASPYIGIYDGNLHNISVSFTSNENETITFENGKTSEGNYKITYYSDSDLKTPLENNEGYKDVLLNDGSVSSYTVYYKIENINDTVNFTSLTGSSTVTIKQKKVVVTPNANDRKYTTDEDTSVVVNEVTDVETGVGEEKINVVNITGSFNDGKEGNDKPVKINGYELEEANDITNLDNYNVVVNDTTATIYDGNWYVSSTSYVGVYDGKYHKININVKGVVNSDTGETEVINNPNITYYSDEACQNRIDSYDGDIDVTDGIKYIYYKVESNDTKYEGTKQGVAFVMIIPADIEINTTAANKKYDGTADADITSLNTYNAQDDVYTLETGITRYNADGTALQDLSGEQFKINASDINGTFVDDNGNEDPSVGDGKKVKVTYDISKVSAVDGTGFKASNYNITVNDTTAKIIANKLMVIATPYDDYYDGSVHGIEVKAYDEQGNEVSLDKYKEINYYVDDSFTTLDEMIKDVTLEEDGGVKTRDIYFKINKEGYEAISGYSSVTIRPLVVEVTPTANDKVYDGNTDAVVNDVDKLKTRVNNESISLTNLKGEFSDPEVGNNKDVTILAGYKIAYENGALEKNYTIKVYDTKASITAKKDEDKPKPDDDTPKKDDDSSGNKKNNNSSSNSCAGGYVLVNGTCRYKVENTSSK